ncbi:MAG TPA: hypothetical protein VFO14_23870 [Vicinamibacterales bacterium]|nr:hypothetical protein [Vicinamibacterales bacterium]
MRLNYLLAIALNLSSTPPTHLHHQQPPAEQFQFTDSEAAPSTLEEMWDLTDAVARVRIEQALVKGLPRAGRPPKVLTEHTARVLEVLKGDGFSERDTIIITVPVGKLTVNDQTISAIAAGSRVFHPGEELLVFLTRLSTGDYDIAYGPAGFYSLEAERITLPGDARRWPTFAGRGITISRGDLLAAVRMLKQRG